MKDKQFDFAADKNHWLKEKRNISFEEVIAALDEGKLALLKFKWVKLYL